MTYGAAIILGLVQGIAEFLPISSSGHLSVLQNLFGLTNIEQGHMFFDVLLHLGTLISICVCYWSDIVDMVKELWSIVTGRNKLSGAEGEGAQSMSAARLFMMIVIATLPLFVVLPINDLVETLYYKSVFIGAAFLLTGAMLFVCDKMTSGTKTARNMRIRDALIIGCCQAVATVPGLSRSGTTISAGVATGLDRAFAVKFSFLMSLPAVFGANLLAFFDAVQEGVDLALVPYYLVGMAVAMLSGIAAISLMKLIAKKSKFGYFAYYCWGAGVLTIILSVVFPTY